MGADGGGGADAEGRKGKRESKSVPLKVRWRLWSEWQHVWHVGKQGGQQMLVCGETRWTAEVCRKTVVEGIKWDQVKEGRTACIMVLLSARCYEGKSRVGMRPCALGGMIA